MGGFISRKRRQDEKTREDIKRSINEQCSMAAMKIVTEERLLHQKTILQDQISFLNHLNSNAVRTRFITNARKRRLRRIVCPVCTQINNIDPSNCVIEALSGKIPDIYEFENIEGVEEPTECCICLTNYADVTLLSCGHTEICGECARILMK